MFDGITARRVERRAPRFGYLLLAATVQGALLAAIALRRPEAPLDRPLPVLIVRSGGASSLPPPGGLRPGAPAGESAWSLPPVVAAPPLARTQGRAASVPPPQPPLPKTNVAAHPPPRRQPLNRAAARPRPAPRSTESPAVPAPRREPSATARAAPATASTTSARAAPAPASNEGQAGPAGSGDSVSPPPGEASAASSAGLAGRDRVEGAGGADGNGAAGAGRGWGSAAGGPAGGPAHAGAGWTRPEQAVRNCVQESIRVPRGVDAGAAGTLTVRFAVEPDGRASRFEVVGQSPDPRLGAAVWRAVKACRWIPGSDPRGTPASIWVTMPVRFVAS